MPFRMYFVSYPACIIYIAMGWRYPVWNPFLPTS